MKAVPMAMLIFALVAAGCSGTTPASPTPTVTAVDAINGVTDMVPAPGTALQPGQTVTFSGTPAYALYSADLGMVQMTVEDQNDRPLPTDGSHVVVAHRGTGDATITQTVTLPMDGVTAVHLYFLLVPAGATSTQAVVRLTYPVH